MLLAFDIGNTNITLGVFNGEKLVFTSRMATDLKRMEDQYAIEIRDILDINGCNAALIDGSIISSVVPPLTNRIKKAVNKFLNIHPLVLGPGIKTGLNIRIDNPAQLGADLVAVSVAALDQYPCPNVVCDLGTATTISVLDSAGNMIGGQILSGIVTSLDALIARAAQLHQVSFETPEHLIGRNTIECLQSGMVYGTAAMLDGMIARIEQELGQPVTAIATGGFSQDIVRHCRRNFHISENLVLEGLRIIYMKNR